MNHVTITALIFFVLVTPLKQSFGQEASPLPARTYTLDQCVALALERNPILQTEREKIAELESDYLVAASGLYPRISVSAYYQRVDSERLGVLPTMAYGRETLAQARLKQVLFDGGRVWHGRQAAVKAEGAQRISAETARLDTILAVSQAYYRVLEAREILRVSETSREQRQAFYALTEAYHQAGRATKLEFLKAQAQVFDAERNLSQAQEAFRLSELILKKIIAADPGQEIVVAEELPQEFPDVPAEELLVQRTLESNPDMKRLAMLREQSEASLRSARATFWPEVSAQGTYGYRNRDTAEADTEWTAGVFLEWGLFEGGLTRGQVGKARSKVNQIAWNEKALRTQVQVDLREALGNVRTAQAAIRSSRMLVEAQEEAYQAATEFYKRGKSTYIEVLAAQVDLTQAKAAYIRAVGDYQNTHAKLDRVVGAGVAVSTGPARQPDSAFQQVPPGGSS